ncbi:RAMP superfamily CRISPR-associated protein [Microbispora sp. H10670]|uniref:RAMP superfamily CRISPR-associated protein n=1 Tax=Microbispora sp. H10670 TaxID=2729108 RepID=UPI00160450ED|nr:RAMP superfamily CRISPR-associated protein [Microbispora sp. H10670]
MNIDLELFLISDWQVGTGTGAPGYVDRLVQRDAVPVESGQVSGPAAPIVPAKTLTGVWRDACEVAANALDSGPAGVWYDWVTFLFGGQYAPDDSAPSSSTPASTASGQAPGDTTGGHAGSSGTGSVRYGRGGGAGRALRPAALSLDGPLRLPERLAELLRRRPRVAWAATFRKPGVAIDPVTGTAETRKLRFVETARGGVTLMGRGQLRGFEELDQAQREAAIALLAAGARLIEGIGGNRRRGAGRCRLTLRSRDTGMDLDFAALGRTPPAPPPASPTGTSDERPLPPPRRTAERGWDRAELLITVTAPVLAGATVQGNLVEGQAYLPGWCLMSEVARRIGGPAHALVRTGDLVVTAATPMTPDGGRTLPVPRVLVHAKGARQIVTGNRMTEDATEGKSYREGHIAVEGGETGTVVSPAFTLRMHNTIRDDVQRPTRDVGGVYIYQALAAGTALRAEVRVRRGVLEPGWEGRLSGRWRVGRSSKDDYGQVRVEARAVAVPPGDEVRLHPKAMPAGRGGDGPEPGLLRVWLLSDLLVRDVRLRPSTHPGDVARALERALAAAGSPGVRLTPLTSSPVDGRVTTALGAHRTESWHRGWGLPRATLYGLSAGSCLTFTVTGGPIAPEALDELRTAGLGERRAEGFGQLEIDHDLLLRSFRDRPVAGSGADAGPDEDQGIAVEPVPASGEARGPLRPDEDGHDAGRVYERAAWRAEIGRRCEVVMADPGRRSAILPDGVTTTQLNGLREVVGERSAEGALHRLAWLTRENKGRRPWPEERVEFLRRLIRDPEEVWTLLGLPEDELTVTRDGAAVLRAELHAESVRALITACVAAYAREQAATGTDAISTATGGGR